MSVDATRWAYSLFTEACSLSPMQRSVLLFLCFKHHTKTGVCCPSYKTISVATGFSRRHVINIVSDLSKAGLLDIKIRRDAGGMTSNSYALMGVKITTPLVHKSTLGGGEPEFTRGVVNPSSPNREGYCPRDSGQQRSAFSMGLVGGRFANGSSHE